MKYIGKSWFRKPRRTIGRIRIPKPKSGPKYDAAQALIDRIEARKVVIAQAAHGKAFKGIS